MGKSGYLSLNKFYPFDGIRYLTIGKVIKIDKRYESMDECYEEIIVKDIKIDVNKNGKIFFDGREHTIKTFHWNDQKVERMERSGSYSITFEKCVDFNLPQLGTVIYKIQKI